MPALMLALSTAAEAKDRDSQARIQGKLLRCVRVRDPCVVLIPLCVLTQAGEEHALNKLRCLTGPTTVQVLTLSIHMAAGR